MKTPVILAFVFLALFLLPLVTVLGETSSTYTIQIGSDGSATWTVSQTLEVNSSVETLQTLQNRITSLVESAEIASGRNMAATVDSLTFTRPANSSYIQAEYVFEWENFSEVEKTRIVIGDVFLVPNFFDQLYGDGEVYMTYPSNYVVDTVQPAPFMRNDSIQTLEWLGTKDLENGGRIVLEQESAAPSFIDTLGANGFLILGLIAIAACSSVGFYLFGHHRKKKVDASEPGKLTNLPVMEDDEQKTVKLLQSSGGTLRQSAIIDKFGFSKAKASQLLAVLERKGVVRRYKKGRDKIVVLNEHANGENS